ncbi:hypothetical protein [Streptomyces sp. NBC_00648]|uniref:hypothetical protein n=1 Tax=Streptomyces sp. NBC_00648 TaxID=2975797 RepID=UPI00324BE15A
MDESKNSARTGPTPLRRRTDGRLDRRRVIPDAALGVPAAPPPAGPKEPDDPAQYRHCHVCHEPGADTATRMLVADSGASHTSYAHYECAEATGAEVITP